MTFTEKLKRLTADRNKAELSRLAGLPSNAISDYINKGHAPRLDLGFSLATTFGVPLEWLADDRQDWPPVSAGQSPECAAPAEPMTFTEKLKRLTADRNKAEVSVMAGLSKTGISNYIAKGSFPRGDIGIRMARALAVDPKWLLDDAAGWPPPTAAAPAPLPIDQQARQIIRDAADQLQGPALYRLLQSAAEALAESAQGPRT